MKKLCTSQLCLLCGKEWGRIVEYVEERVPPLSHFSTAAENRTLLCSTAPDSFGRLRCRAFGGTSILGDPRRRHSKMCCSVCGC